MRRGPHSIRLFAFAVGVMMLASCAPPVETTSSTAESDPSLPPTSTTATMAANASQDLGNKGASPIDPAVSTPERSPASVTPADEKDDDNRSMTQLSPDVPTGDPFELFATARKLENENRRVIEFARQGKWNDAERLLHQLIGQAPYLPDTRYNLACILALQGKKQPALEELRLAVQKGFVEPDQIAADLDLVSLRTEPQFQQILQLAKDLRSQPFYGEPKASAVIKNQIAQVGPDQAVLDPRFKLIRTFFDWSSPPPANAEHPVTGHGEVGETLRRWYAEGTAAGNWGDLYDNCDRNHSKHKHQEFGTLTRIQYDDSIKKEVPYGLQTLMQHGGVVIGNSSTAATGNPLWRSNPRRAYVNAALVRRLYMQYASNHLYLYPEHKDYDAKHGDVFPANTPYVLTSFGSSGSDRPFMDALFCTLAAFRPEVKKKLVEAGAIAPTLQWVFRNSNKNVPDDETYLTGVAHPAVFNKDQLDQLRMVQRAHDLTVDALPPLVKLKVLGEDQGQLGRDYFDVADRTQLFDTPCAIGRVYRTLRPTTRMVVSAEDSFDINGLPLTYHWRVLSGDPEQIEIRPLDEQGRTVELTIPYTPQHPIVPGASLLSNRIEIGAFVHNGHHYSAPAFITYFSLNNEERTYDEYGDLEQVIYRGGTDKGKYVDPLVDAPKTWRDEYHYSDEGELIGWTRHRDGKSETFTHHGLLVTETDSDGRAIEGAVVQYYPVPLETEPMIRLDYRPTDRRLTIVYAGKEDRLGEVQRPDR